ncbi:MAG: hypothetical protein U5K31_13740 [Balneolaceae bacterium]|nr:hypothetical protein [Balneolaceae bacterium]
MRARGRESIRDIEEARPYLEDPSKTWIKVYGLHDIEKLKTIWSYFDLHPLIQEDIVSTQHVRGVEQLSTTALLSFVLRALRLSDGAGGDPGQPSRSAVVLGDNFVLSFQESDKPWASAPILDRLRIESSRIRQRGTLDYLAYALIGHRRSTTTLSALEGLGDETGSARRISFIEDPDAEHLPATSTGLRRDVTYVSKERYGRASRYARTAPYATSSPFRRGRHEASSCGRVARPA